jgi:hypothetical protein
VPADILPQRENAVARMPQRRGVGGAGLLADRPGWRRPRAGRERPPW